MGQLEKGSTLIAWVRGRSGGRGLRREITRIFDEHSCAGIAMPDRAGGVLVFAPDSSSVRSALFGLLGSASVFEVSLRTGMPDDSFSQTFEFVTFGVGMGYVYRHLFHSDAGLEGHVRGEKQRSVGHAALLTRLFQESQSREFKKIATDEVLRCNRAYDSVIRRNSDLSGISSFRRSMYLRSRRGQLVPDESLVLLNKKMPSRWLIDQLGVPQPAATRSFELPELDEMLRIAPKTLGSSNYVIKPTDSYAATGVYLVVGNKIHSIARGVELPGFDALRAALASDVESGRLRTKTWYLEQAIVEDDETELPAHDLKFYAFYGEIGAVLEVRRYPEKRYCWWSEKGEFFSAGKYDEISERLRGFTAAQAEVAKALSLQLPFPFIRLDFLATSSGAFLFGEFGTKPGYFARFDDSTDQMLGERYLAAEARLHKDLRQGKRFTRFDEFLEHFTQEPSESEGISSSLPSS